MVCLNSRLREERWRKGEALLKATEAALKEIALSGHGIAGVGFYSGHVQMG